MSAAVFDVVSLMSQVGTSRPMQKRLSQVMGCMAKNPSASFPVMLGSVAAREGFYRMLQNDDVSIEKLLEPQVQLTAERAREQARVIVAHDTTEFHFGGEGKREGLGRIHKTDQGFLGHFSLCLTADEEHLPLGVLALEPTVRGETFTSHATMLENYVRPDKESLRWMRNVRVVEDVLDAPHHAIHVMDREGHDYATLSEMLARDFDFVIRGHGNRTLRRPRKKKGEPAPPHSVAGFFATRQGSFQREVPLQARTANRPKGSMKLPARHYRSAVLHFDAATVELVQPAYATEHPPTLRVNMVHVFEDIATKPDGKDGVEWFLTTNLPVDTDAQIAAVVDAYRARWRIEEFFKALKTGCSFEKRQLESLESLLIVLGMFVPIATNLLRIRTRARRLPDTPARELIDGTTLEVLAATAPDLKKPIRAITDALLAIAALGGHIKNNGAPGWIVLLRGYERLQLIEIGWRARSSETDQS